MNCSITPPWRPAPTDARMRESAAVTRNMGLGEDGVTETRKGEQCGTLFAPRREHARFCSAGCRGAWNRQHASDPPAEAGALGWTITAMREPIDRLLRARASDQPHGFAAISEAVWWVTLVDATLVRYHPDAYDAALEGYDAGERRVIDGTFGGLRVVRHWVGFPLGSL